MADFVNPVWNVFEPQVDDRSITEYSYVRYGTTEGLNVSQNNSNGATYRLVTKDLDSYLVPSKMLLDFTFKVVSSDAGQSAITVDRYQLNDNIMCLFSKISHFVNSVPLAETEQPVLTTTIKNLLEYSPDYKNTQGPAQFFYTSDFKPDGSVSDGSFNKDLPQAQRIKSSTLVRVLVPLNRVLGSLEGMSTATRGLEHRIEIVKEDDNRIKRCVFGDDRAAIAPGTVGQAGKILIQEMSIWIPKISPSETSENKFLSIVSNKDLDEKVSYEVYNGYRTSVAMNGATNMNYQITSSSKKPKYVFVAFQKTTRLEGNIHDNDPDNTSKLRNPSIFDNMDLKSIVLKVNSKRFPYEIYRLDFSNPTTNSAGDYNRAYHDFLRILDKDSEMDNGSLVSHGDYKTKYPIFAFDLSRDISLFENVQNNYIEIEAIFGAAIPASVYVNSVICWDRELRLQSDSASLKITRD